MTRRVVVPVLGVWIALVAIAAIAVGRRGEARPSSASRTLSVDVDAAGLQAIDLRTTDGSVEVIGTDEDRIRITTEVSMRETRREWFEKEQADLAKAELVGERHDNKFGVRVRVPGSGVVMAGWTMRVPRRFKVEIAANDGAFVISDVSGGVTINASSRGDSKAGSIRVNVPGGPLDLSLGVGDVQAQTALSSHGPVDVAALVGDAKVTVAGREINSPREPGPGHRLRLGGVGPDAVKLRVSVGTASLEIK